FGQDLAERRRELFGVGGEEGASARRRAAGDGDAVEGTARLERGIAEVRRVVAEAGAVREVAVGEVVARALRAGYLELGQREPHHERVDGRRLRGEVEGYLLGLSEGTGPRRVRAKHAGVLAGLSAQIHVRLAVAQQDDELIAAAARDVRVRPRTEIVARIERVGARVVQEEVGGILQHARDRRRAVRARREQDLLDLRLLRQKLEAAGARIAEGHHAPFPGRRGRVARADL